MSEDQPAGIVGAAGGFSKTYASAVKDLCALPPDVQARIRRAVRDLADDPRPPGCKKLKGRADYSIRVGSYRVLNEVDDSAETVLVILAGHRRSIYRL